MNNQIDFKELGKQILYPDKLPTKEVASDVSRSNNIMTFEAIDSLELINGIKVLEIGFGNAKHLPFLFRKTKEISYYGIDSSETLVKKASANNTLKVKDGCAQFTKAKEDGILDFQNDFIDCCFTTNTLYFWKNPIQHFMEIHRVLRSGGKLALAFIEKNFGKDLPWTLPNFTFYEVNEVKGLLHKTGFVNIEVRQITEKVIGKNGQEATKSFVIMLGQK
jgi:SAM-dependent methyltransferase